MRAAHLHVGLKRRRGELWRRHAKPARGRHTRACAIRLGSLTLFRKREYKTDMQRVRKTGRARVSVCKRTRRQKTENKRMWKSEKKAGTGKEQPRTHTIEDAHAHADSKRRTRDTRMLRRCVLFGRVRRACRW
eukprot:6197704-Pleurochrysis_carterae.AAC.5